MYKTLLFAVIASMLPGYALAQQNYGTPPPCGPQQYCNPAPERQCAPQQIVVNVPRRIEMEGAPAQQPAGTPPLGAQPPAPQGMYVAPPQTGTAVGERNSTRINGFTLHFPELKLSMPSLELPSIQRVRQDANMEINPGSAPFVPMANIPQQPQTMFAGQAYNSPQSLGSPPPSPSPTGAGSCQPGAGAPPVPPCQPAGQAPNAPATPLPPCQPVGQAPGACPAAAPAPVPPQLFREYPPAPLPPKPTQDMTLEMQLRRMEDIERRIDAKLQQLTALQRDLQQPLGRADIQILPAESQANSVRFEPQRDIYDSVRTISISDPRPQANDNRSVSVSAGGTNQRLNPIRGYDASQPPLQSPDASTAQGTPLETRR